MFALGALPAPGLAAWAYALGQAMVSAGQLTAHYANEYADVEADRGIANRTLFSGGSGVLGAGGLPPRVALVAALVTSAIVVCAAAVLAFESLVVIPLALFALCVSWLYSMPPVRLLGTGWGELATSLVVAGAVPLMGAASQSASPPAALWWSVVVLLPVHMALMLAFEIPDLESDAAAGKRVLAVRMGRRCAGTLMAALLAAAASLLAVAVVAGGLPARSGLLAGSAALPVGVMLYAWRSHRHGWFTASAVAALVCAAGGLLAGRL